MTHDSFDSSDAGFGAPPIGVHDPSDLPPVPGPDSTWPSVIGGLSLAYAIAGLLCGGLTQIWAVFGLEWQMELMGLTDVDLSVPPHMQAVQVLGLIMLVIFGVYLLLGAIGMLRRERAGFVRIRRWAIARLVWCVIALLLAFLTLPASVDQGVRMQEAIFEKMQEQDPNATFPPVNREQQMMMAVVSVIVATGVTAIYPVFLGIYLSSSKRRYEVETWA